MGTARLAVFGGSVAAGTSAKLDVVHDCFQYQTTTVNQVRDTQTWWSILGRVLSDWVDGGVQVVSSAGDQATAEKTLSRLARELPSGSTDYVLALLGPEDALAGTDPESFRKNLSEVVQGIKERQARPVLATPTPISERRTAAGMTLEEVRRCQARAAEYARIVRDLAERKSLPLVDLHAFFMGNPLAYDHLFEGWLPDGVAQSAMASFVAGELAELLGARGFPKATLCHHRKAYTDAENPDRKHSGFTTLTIFGGRFYLGFCSGFGHVSAGSFARVLISEDGIRWEKEAVLEVPGVESTGQPEFLETNGRLLAACVTTPLPTTPPSPYVTYGFERLGPGQWGEPFALGTGVFWHIRKWRDQYVSAAYAWPEKDAAVKLYASPDGRNWKVVCNIFPYETGANETDLWVEDDTLMAFARTGAGSRDEMLISTYVSDEHRWETVSTGRIIEAPIVFRAGDRLMVGGRYCSQGDDRFRALQDDWAKFCRQAADAGGDPARVGEIFEADPGRVEEYHHGLRTGIFAMDGTRPRLVMELPSAGDSSYVGVVQHGEEYVVSDYSMHEHYRPIYRPGDWNTPCDIYISRIRFGG